MSVMPGNERQNDGSIKKRELPYVLAAGDPRVMQLAAPADRKPEQPAYLYVGVRPGKTDTQGRLIEGEIWLVLCEEPPDDDHIFAKHKPRPLPGLTQRGDSVCIATTKGPVKAAAAASERWLRKREEPEDAVITGVTSGCAWVTPKSAAVTPTVVVDTDSLLSTVPS